MILFSDSQQVPSKKRRGEGETRTKKEVGRISEGARTVGQTEPGPGALLVQAVSAGVLHYWSVHCSLLLMFPPHCGFMLCSFLLSCPDTVTLDQRFGLALSGL